LIHPPVNYFSQNKIQEEKNPSWAFKDESFPQKINLWSFVEAKFHLSIFL